MDVVLTLFIIVWYAIMIITIQFQINDMAFALMKVLKLISIETEMKSGRSIML